MEALTSVLSRERLLAELVVFKLVELRGLLQSGESRFLGWAAEEVERATASLREAELQRATIVAGLAEQRGLPEGDLPLSAVLADAPEPWRGVLGELSDRLRHLCVEARELSAANARLADTGLRGVEHLLGRAEDRSPTDDLGLYGPSGRRESRLPRARVAASL